MALYGFPAWAHAMYPYHMNGTDMVGRSVNAHALVDHASVGLTQAHPNNFNKHQIMIVHSK